MADPVAAFEKAMAAMDRKRWEQQQMRDGSNSPNNMHDRAVFPTPIFDEI